MNQRIMSNESYQLNVQLPSALQNFKMSFRLLFICPASTLLFWLTFPSVTLLFSRKSFKKPLYSTC